MNRYKKLASNTIILAIGQFASKILVILLMGFYQSMLGKEGYGEVGTIIDTATLIMAFATLSIGESIIRFGLDKEYNHSQVFSIGMRTTFLGLLGSVFLIPLIGALSGAFPDNNVLSLLNRYSWLTLLYVFTGSVKSSVALFVRSSVNVRLYAIDGIITTVMNILFNLLFLLAFNLGIVGYLLSVVLADLCSIIFLTYMGKLGRYVILFGIDKDLRRTMLKFSIPMIPTTVMWWVINVSDTFFVSGMLGFSELGCYKAAYRFPSMISLISGIFSQAWNMSAIKEKNSRTIAKFYTDVFSAFSSLIFVIGAGMLLLIKPAIEIFCIEEFHIAYIYTPFLIMAVVNSCFGTFMGSIYLASQQSVRSLVTCSIGAGLNLILNAILIPIIGNHGAAIATFISFSVIFVIRAIDSRKIVRMDPKLPKMVTNTVCLFAMSMIIIFVTNMVAYYIILSVIFLFVVVINFRSLVSAINKILHKN